MAPPLPEYKQEVEVQPRALPDRQAAISSLGDRLTQFGLGAAKAVQKMSQGDIAAEKAAAQIQIRDGITRIRENVLDPTRFNNQATESYDAQVAGLTKGVLETANPKIKAAVANFASYYGDRNRDVVVGRVESLKKNQLVGGLQEYNSKITDDAINALLSDEVIPDPEDKTKMVSKGDVLIGQVNQKNDAAMNSGLITPKEAFAYKQAAHESYAEAGYLKQFRHVLADQSKDPNQWIESLGKNKSIDPAMKHKVQAQALGMMTQAQQSVNTSTNLIKQQADDTIRQVSTGELDINDPHVSNVKLRTEALPEEDQQDIEHRLTAASVFSTTKKSLKFIPFMQSKDLLKKLEPLAGDPEFKYKNKINSALESQVNEYETQFKKDPFGYVMDNPDVIKAFEARNVAANDGMIKIQPAQLQSINPLAVALDKERMMGANDQQLSVLRNDQAATIVSAVEAQTDPVQQLQFVNDVYDSYGKYKTIAARDLKKAGMPENILALAGLQNIPNSKPFIQGMLTSFQQSQAIQDRLKERNVTGEKMPDFKQAAVSNLNELFKTYGNAPGTEDLKSSMVNTVAIASAGYFLQKNGAVSAAKAQKQIADAVFNNRYSGFLKEVRVPINVPLSNAKDALYAAEKDLPNVPFLGLKREPGSRLTKGEQLQEDMDVIKAGHWRSIGDDSGAYWVDAHGFTPTYIKAGTRTRYEVHWKDLQDKTSELHGLIAKHKRRFMGIF